MYTIAEVKSIAPDGTLNMGCLTQACQGCKAALFCNNKDQSEFQALNPQSVPVSQGDLVELFMPPGRTILSTILVFALPIALFPLGYLLCKFIWPTWSEVLHALGGLLAMALAFGISALVSIIHKRRLMPVVTRIMAKDQKS